MDHKFFRPEFLRVVGFSMTLGVSLILSTTPVEVSKEVVEVVDVSEGPGTALSVCRQLLPVPPTNRVIGHTHEPLPVVEHCGWDYRGVPYCCPEDINN